MATTLAGTTPLPDAPSAPIAATGHYHTERAGTIRLTDTAVVFELGESLAVFPYRDIAAVSGGRGVLFGSLTMVVAGRQERITWIAPNDAAPELVRRIAERIA
jgi:hypothetical protein